MGAVMVGVAVTDARGAGGVRMGEADVFLAGLGQGAFEVAGDLTE
jgi:hypothetical protein